MLSATLNKLIFLLILLGLGIAGYFFLPQILESTSSSCSALEMKELRLNAETRSDPVWAALQKLSNGAYAEQIMRTRRPDAAPFVSCAEAYWFAGRAQTAGSSVATLPAQQPAPAANPWNQPSPPAASAPDAADTGAYHLQACSSAPNPAIDRLWQVSAPRDAAGVAGNAPVEIGLRNKLGQSNERYSVAAEITGNGSRYESKAATLLADQWAYFRYPDQFAEPKALSPGLYTVTWKTDAGAFLACDGFYVAK